MMHMSYMLHMVREDVYNQTMLAWLTDQPMSWLPVAMVQPCVH